MGEWWGGVEWVRVEVVKNEFTHYVAIAYIEGEISAII